MIVRPSRRHLLRSAASTLALPFMASAMPRSAWAQVPASPKRVLYYYVPNGLQPEAFNPISTGPDWEADPERNPILVPMDAWRAKINVITGLTMPSAEDDKEGDHARGTGAFLTSTLIKYTSGSDIQNDTSIDQLIANELPLETPFRSLQVGTEPGGSTGDCNAGYSCAYTRNLSWAGAATPLPPIVDPVLLFERMFGPSSTGLSAETVARRAILRTHVLDHVNDQIQALRPKLSSGDALKLDEYLTGVEELQARLAVLGQGECADTPTPAAPTEFATQLGLTHDMLVLAMQCDMSRVLTFMFGQSASNRSFGFMGVADAHHQLSHHQDAVDKLEKLYQVETWILGEFASLLTKMDAVVEPDGNTLLDNSLVYFSSEISDGNTHSHVDLPVILAGSAGGAIATGQHHRADGALTSEVLLATATALGSTMEGFRDAAAPYPGLLIDPTAP